MDAQEIKPALLLIAHGSRHAEANEDLHWLAGELSRTGSYRKVVASLLELADPSIPEGAMRCVESGAACVILVPYFLSAGVHVRRDLENHRSQLSAAHPGIEFLLAEPLGRHPSLANLVEERVRGVREKSVLTTEAQRTQRRQAENEE